jgi:diguanylate cyclase (GGDEF)-like protein
MTELFQRLLVYLLLSGFFLCIWILFITRTVRENTTVILSILYGLLVLSLFNPLYMLIQRYAKKLIFPKKLDYQKTIMDMSMKVVSVLDYQRLIEIIRDTIVNIVGSSSFALLLHDEESDSFMPIAVHGVDSKNMTILPSMHDLLRLIRLLNREIFRDDLEEGGEILSDEILSVFDAYRAAFVIPMTYQANLRGVLFIGERKSHDLYTRRDIELLKILSNHIVIALDNARLYELAIRDGLTRLYISRFFRQRISEEIMNSVRSGRFLSLLMIDIDHFKTINDTYGHPTGDQILKELAHVITEQIRLVDIASRYGGEEFAVILPETDNSHALAIAQRIRKKIENTEFCKGIRRTVSIGVATIDGKKTSARDNSAKAATRTIARGRAEAIKTEIIKKADEALYEAKNSGRNTCVNGGVITI